MGASKEELSAAHLAAGSQDAEDFLSKIDEVAALVDGLARGTVTPEVNAVLGRARALRWHAARLPDAVARSMPQPLRTERLRSRSFAPLLCSDQRGFARVSLSRAP